jgi:hypothetical protein
MENFRENQKFVWNEISRNLTNPFSHDFRIYAKIEKCIFASVLV